MNGEKIKARIQIIIGLAAAVVSAGFVIVRFAPRLFQDLIVHEPPHYRDVLFSLGSIFPIVYGLTLIMKKVKQVRRIFWIWCIGWVLYFTLNCLGSLVYCPWLERHAEIDFPLFLEAIFGYPTLIFLYLLRPLSDMGTINLDVLHGLCGIIFMVFLWIGLRGVEKIVGQKDKVNEVAVTSEEDNIQLQKPRMSKVAIWSLVIPLLLCIGSLSFYVVFRSGVSETLEVCFFLFPSAGFCLAPLTFILGIWGIVRVAKSKGALKGYIPAVLGLIVTVFCLHCSLVGVACVRPQARIEQCKILLMEIGKAMVFYSNDYDGKYPTAERWSDLLIEHCGLEEEIFGDWHSRYGGYALNPGAKPDSTADVVLVFEVESEWGEWKNLFGGSEKLTVEIHHIPTILSRKSIRGCNVLFNDGHVEFIKTEEVGELQWEDEEKE